jgi:hypothetical protein
LAIFQRPVNPSEPSKLSYNVAVALLTIPELQKRFTGAFEAYDEERSRRNHPFVGQFADLEGAQSDQYGVYGMAAWVILCTALGIDDSSPAGKRKRDCIDQLKQWTSKTTSLSPSAANSAEYELRYIVPKICCAYRALQSVDSSQAQQLESYIRAVPGAVRPMVLPGAHPDGQPPNQYATALVLNTFASNENFRNLLPEMRKSLLESLRSNRNGDVHRCYLDLYALNAVVRSLSVETNPDATLARDARKKLKSTVVELLRMIKKDPFSAVDPIVLHFNDGTRTRYLRFLAHLCVLESLILMSSRYVRYYAYYVGRRIWSRLSSALRGGGLLTTDPCGDRISFMTCLQIWDTFSLLPQDD